ncbi:unnamed protein product [Rotaria socialis]|uniref:Protein-tyrosine sulfotransferase n=1 Tax=Rotaria socialis TaxID=392032 RepID=A0A817Q1D7_9BILA|nr:unnamed protein product [Rotaria socialis]CAF3179499.1 unnamed protein product [Rotaria socialis]CAF3769988.1 unnamed protein product [Rotaria socialis]CAF4167262.1 unnamed protein product [Rotaria socialis]CAF4234453.1 unnamed protein product [Rotaria socialis]
MPWLRRPRRFLSNMSTRTHRFFVFCIMITIVVISFFLLRNTNSFISQQEQICDSKLNQIKGRELIHHDVSSEKPIFFIGGMPRSGTTLVRAIIDSHPQVRCGEETRVIPRILSMRTAWEKSAIEWNRLLAGGMTEQILDSAVRAFIYEILFLHGPSADILCDKDPFVLKYASYITSIFPSAKFLLVARDARAVIHSVITRKVTITGFSLTDYRQNFKLWNQGFESMYQECKEVGKYRCLIVYYEQLVLQPKQTIKNILKFLNITWVNDVLHHEELIGKKISLSKTEHSSAQVVKPINLEALTKWVGHIPVDVLREIDKLAPMLKKLGYDTKSNVPSYGIPDKLVLRNMDRLRDNAKFWDAQAKAYARNLSNTAIV